jgi:hypothetical protein
MPLNSRGGLWVEGLAALCISVHLSILPRPPSQHSIPAVEAATLSRVHDKKVALWVEKGYLL